jgi:hypothetical protein
LTAIVTPIIIAVANAGDCEGAIFGGNKIVKTNERQNAG